MSTYQFAVIGNPIAHSLSPPIHHAFADSLDLSVEYQRVLAPLASEDKNGFQNIVSNFFAGGGHGLNVTVPFKQIAFELCEQLSDRAKIAKAVNTLYMHEGKLCGDNTDGTGLVNAIGLLSKDNKWQLKNSRIAIIGAGGACRGVILPLLQAGVASITIANRTLSKAEDLIADISKATDLATDKLQVISIAELSGQFDIIINATSSSLYGDNLQLNDALNCHCAYDMVYSKDGSPTSFLAYFQQKNADIADGFGMLIGQAAVSFEIWTGYMPNLQDRILAQKLFRAC